MDAQRRFVLAGVGGVGVALVLSVITWAIIPMVPALLGPARVGVLIARIFLLVLGLIAVFELPMMLAVMVQMMRRNTGTGLLPMVHFGYVFFPAVYGLMGALLTGQRWWLGMMFFLVLLRLVMSYLAIRLPKPADPIPAGESAS